MQCKKSHITQQQPQVSAAVGPHARRDTQLLRLSVAAKLGVSMLAYISATRRMQGGLAQEELGKGSEGSQNASWPCRPLACSGEQKEDNTSYIVNTLKSFKSFGEQGVEQQRYKELYKK